MLSSFSVLIQNPTINAHSSFSNQDVFILQSLGITSTKDRDILKKKIKEMKTALDKDKKQQEKEQKAKEKLEKQALKKKAKWPWVDFFEHHQNSSELSCSVMCRVYSFVARSLLRCVVLFVWLWIISFNFFLLELAKLLHIQKGPYIFRVELRIGFLCDVLRALADTELCVCTCVLYCLCYIPNDAVSLVNIVIYIWLLVPSCS